MTEGKAIRWSSMHWLAAGVPLFWLLAFLALPFVLLIGLSFSDVADSIPPVTPMVGLGNQGLTIAPTLRAYELLSDDPLYLVAFWNGVTNAFWTTLLCVLIGYPMAYAIAQAPPARRKIWLFLAILPFWTSFLMRTYAWMGLIRDSGPVNNALIGAGLISEPISVLNTPAAVLLVMVYSYLPFFILPMYAVLDRLPKDLIEAATDLGAKPLRSFLTVTLPLSLPGLISGAILVFIPAVGEYVIPDLVGNTETMMIGGILWNEFFTNRDWPMAATVAFFTIALLVVPFVVLRLMAPALRKEAII
jgi:putrescine transport system permease protein